MPDQSNTASTKVGLTIKNINTGDLIVLNNVVPSSNISETPASPNYTEYSIAGRSTPPANYSGGSARTVSFSLKLHRDLLSTRSPFTDSTTPFNQRATSESDASNKFQDIINKFKALSYPSYKSGVKGPKVAVVLGNSIKIFGYGSASISYDPQPIDKFGRFMSVSISMSVTELKDVAYSTEQVSSGGMNDVTW